MRDPKTKGKDDRMKETKTRQKNERGNAGLKNRESNSTTNREEENRKREKRRVEKKRGKGGEKAVESTYLYLLGFVT